MADFGVKLEARTNGVSKRAYTKADDEAIKALYEEGKSVKDIAAEVGRTPNSVTYRVRFMQGKIKKA